VSTETIKQKIAYTRNTKKQTKTKSSATAEIARDADDDFYVDDVHSALTLVFNSFNSIIIL